MFGRRRAPGIPAGITAHAQPVLPEWLDVFSANLVAWFDPTDASTITLAGSKVSTFANKVPGGSAWNATNGTDAQRPTYSATLGHSGGATLVYTAASATRLVSGAVALNQPSTVIARARPGIVASNRTVTDGLTNNTRRLYFVVDEARAYAGGAAEMTLSSAVINTWYKMASTYDGASSIGRIDSTAVGATSIGTANSSGITMGAFADGTTPFEGRISEVFVLNRALSQPELAAFFAGMG
jgi:concanavalin A-like lectin/glucanase superfamily protein